MNHYCLSVGRALGFSSTEQGRADADERGTFLYRQFEVVTHTHRESVAIRVVCPKLLEQLIQLSKT